MHEVQFLSAVGAFVTHKQIDSGFAVGADRNMNAKGILSGFFYKSFQRQPESFRGTDDPAAGPVDESASFFSMTWWSRKVYDMKI